MNNIFKISIIGFFIGCLIWGILIYPFRDMQYTNSSMYSDYEEAKKSYQNYRASHDQPPRNLDFLPSRILDRIGKDGYPIKLEGNDLVYHLDKPYYINGGNILKRILNNDVLIYSIIIGPLDTSS